MAMEIKRREFIKGAGVAAAGAMAGLPGSRAFGGESRPNVLLIMVDQLRFPRWTVPGITPNIDRLAASGVSFDSHFVSASPCSPSRACLVTGLYTTQNKMFTNCDFVEGEIQPSLDPKLPTLGHMFGQAGYQTPYRGKWHLTRRADRNKKDPLLDYGYTGWDPPEAFFGGPPYCGDVFDPRYTRDANTFLKSDEAKKPWHMVFSLVNPHDICAYPRYYPQTKLKPIITDRPPDNWTDDLKGKPKVQLEYQKRYVTVGGKIDVNDGDAWRRYLDYYARCQTEVDKHIGEILDTLEATGQRENTIIAFTADHGEMGGSHKLRTKGTFAYEEVMNVPLIFSWPGHIPAGQKTHAFASNVDVAPTLLSLSGVKTDNYLPGIDLSPVLTDPAGGSVRDECIFHQDWEVQFTINKKTTDSSSFAAPSHIRALRNREWKYVYYFTPGIDGFEEELYDLKNDPLEMKNLALDAGYQTQLKTMKDRLFSEEARLDSEFNQR